MDHQTSLPGTRPTTGARLTGRPASLRPDRPVSLGETGSDSNQFANWKSEQTGGSLRNGWYREAIAAHTISEAREAIVREPLMYISSLKVYSECIVYTFVARLLSEGRLSGGYIRSAQGCREQVEYCTDRQCEPSILQSQSISRYSAPHLLLHPLVSSRLLSLALVSVALLLLADAAFSQDIFAAIMLAMSLPRSRYRSCLSLSDSSVGFSPER